MAKIALWTHCLHAECACTDLHSELSRSDTHGPLVERRYNASQLQIGANKVGLGFMTLKGVSSEHGHRMILLGGAIMHQSAGSEP